MPGTGPKWFKCVLCNKCTKPKERRKICNETGKALRKYFLVDKIQDEVICNKCNQKCYAIRQKETGAAGKNDSAGFDERQPSPKRQKTVSVSSPPSVSIQIPCTSKSHAYCFICKKPGPKLIVAPTIARFMAFVRKELFVPAGSRCCPSHLTDDGHLTSEALDKIKHTHDHSLFSRSSILELLQQTREFALSTEKSRLDFDNPSCLSDDDYICLTGLSKSQFDELITDVEDIRPSKSRSIRTCVAILLTKLRSALSNRMLGTLFNMSKSQVSTYNK